MQRRPYFSVDVVLLNVSKMCLGIILLSSLMIVSSYGCLLREVVKKRSFYGKKAPMGTHLATVVSMRMNRIQRTITNTYNMGYVLDLTCQYLG